jgi:hypothetical protein
MFCPKCGENYNEAEPRCPWCDAENPIFAEPKSLEPDEGDSPEPEIKAAEEKEECLTYKPKSWKQNAFTAYFFACYFVAFFLGFFGILILLSFEKEFIVVGLLILSIPATIFFELYDSKNWVNEIKLFKDRFVLCTRYDEIIFSIDSTEPYKIENDVFGRKIFVFCQNGQYYHINEREFPEVAEIMKKLYCS